MQKFYDYKYKLTREYYDQVILPIESKLEAGNMKVIHTEKLDGFNIQLSYLEELDCLIIGSKNVTILANREKDLELYQGAKYKYTNMIALEVFRMLEKIDSQSFKKRIKNHTLVGEYIGSNENLIRYEEKKIVFYLIVDNY